MPITGCTYACLAHLKALIQLSKETLLLLTSTFNVVTALTLLSVLVELHCSLYTIAVAIVASSLQSWEAFAHHCTTPQSCTQLKV